MPDQYISEQSQENKESLRNYPGPQEAWQLNEIWNPGLGLRIGKKALMKTYWNPNKVCS